MGSKLFNLCYPISHSHNRNQIIESEVQKRIVAYIQSEETRLASIIKKLETEKRISSSVFIKFMSTFGSYQKNSVTFDLIKEGIIEHFNGHFVSSIHILVPQVEATLRAILSSKGFIPLKLERKRQETEVQDNILGELLHDKNKDVEYYLGEDFTRYLIVKFIDTSGINLRNKVSHGLIDSIEEFNHIISYSLIHVLVMLIKKSSCDQ
jgi:hypothetical protein